MGSLSQNKVSFCLLIHLFAVRESVEIVQRSHLLFIFPVGGVIFSGSVDTGEFDFSAQLNMALVVCSDVQHSWSVQERLLFQSAVGLTLLPWQPSDWHSGFAWKHCSRLIQKIWACRLHTEHAEMRGTSEMQLQHWYSLESVWRHNWWF